MRRAYPRRIEKQPVNTINIQEQLDNTITSIKSQLDLYKSLKELAEDMPEDRAIQEQLRISRMEIRNNVVLLQKTGYSMVDLLSRFGTELFKSQILEARERISKEENRNGTLLLTDLFSEDSFVDARSGVDTQTLRQYASDLGIQKTLKPGQIPMSREKIRSHPYYGLITQILEGKAKEELRQVMGRVDDYGRPLDVEEKKENLAERFKKEEEQLVERLEGESQARYKQEIKKLGKELREQQLRKQQEAILEEQFKKKQKLLAHHFSEKLKEEPDKQAQIVEQYKQEMEELIQEKNNEVELEFEQKMKDEQKNLINKFKEQLQLQFEEEKKQLGEKREQEEQDLKQDLKQQLEKADKRLKEFRSIRKQLKKKIKEAERMKEEAKILREGPEGVKVREKKEQNKTEKEINKLKSKIEKLKKKMRGPVYAPGEVEEEQVKGQPGEEEVEGQSEKEQTEEEQSEEEVEEQAEEEKNDQEIDSYFGKGAIPEKAPLGALSSIELPDKDENKFFLAIKDNHTQALNKGQRLYYANEYIKLYNKDKLGLQRKEKLAFVFPIFKKKLGGK